MQYRCSAWAPCLHAAWMPYWISCETRSWHHTLMIENGTHLCRVSSSSNFRKIHITHSMWCCRSGSFLFLIRMFPTNCAWSSFLFVRVQYIIRACVDGKFAASLLPSQCLQNGSDNYISVFASATFQSILRILCWRLQNNLFSFLCVLYATTFFRSARYTFKFIVCVVKPFSHCIRNAVDSWKHLTNAMKKGF